MAPVLPANLTQEKTAELEAEPSDQVTGAMGGVAKPITMEEVANLLSRIVAPPAAPAEPTPEKRLQRVETNRDSELQRRHR